MIECLFLFGVALNEKTYSRCSVVEMTYFTSFQNHFLTFLSNSSSFFVSFTLHFFLLFYFEMASFLSKRFVSSSLFVIKHVSVDYNHCLFPFILTEYHRSVIIKSLGVGFEVDFEMFERSMIYPRSNLTDVD